MRSQGPSWQYEGTGAGGCIADSVMNICTALGRYSWGGGKGGEGNRSLNVSAELVPQTVRKTAMSAISICTSCALCF